MNIIKSNKRLILEINDSQNIDIKIDLTINVSYQKIYCKSVIITTKSTPKHNINIREGINNQPTIQLNP